MAMPAVHRLRELEPESHIAILCPAKLRDLWQHNPHVNQVIPFDRPADVDRLRAGRYDVAVLFPNSFRAAWECWRAGIDQRVGFAGQWRRALLTDVVPEPAGEKPVTQALTVAGQTFKRKHYPVIRHLSQRYLDIVGHLGASREFIAPRLFLANEDLSPLRKFFHDTGEPFIGIHAGAEYGPAKRWPAERFAEVAQRVSQQIDCRFLVFGGPGEVDLANQIAAALRAADPDPNFVINVAGKTSLLELCGLIKFCRLLISNDTGPMHLAVALGTPVVAIFGSTSAPATRPTGPRDIVLHQPVECSPCFLRDCPIDFRCMNQITVESVTAAVLQVWQQTEPTRGHA
jgi:heptosyltransferase-2